MDIRSGWYTPKEIMQLQGMPGTVQGVHKRAKREGWRVRKRLGVRGPAIEYNIFERIQIPPETAAVRSFTRELSERDAGEKLEVIWCMAFRQCTDQEKEHLIKHLMSNGINSFVSETEAFWVQVVKVLKGLPESVCQKLLDLCHLELERKEEGEEASPKLSGQDG